MSDRGTGIKTLKDCKFCGIICIIALYQPKFSECLPRFPGNRNIICSIFITLKCKSITFSSCPSVRSSVRLSPNCEHNFLKTNEPLLMQIGTSDPRGKDIKRLSTLEVRRSKIKVTRGEGRFGGLAEASFLTPWVE